MGEMMTGSGGKQRTKLPRRYWKAAEPFTRRAAPAIGIILSVLTISIIGFQAWIYYRQAEIMEQQTFLSRTALIGVKETLNKADPADGLASEA
jgi:hypothetical protein